jgi:hypothetical protein
MTSNKTDFHDTTGAVYIEEVARQLALLSGLIAGFAFAALTQVSFETTTPTGMKWAFIICTSFAVLLGVLAAFIAAILTFASKLSDFATLNWALPQFR